MNDTNRKKESLSYRDAGVDIDAGNALVERIKPAVSKTFRPEVLTGLGGFGALFKMDLERWKEPLLVSGTDGVGTKLMLARLRSPSVELAMAVLLHDVGKPATFTVSDRIRFNRHHVVGSRMAEDICRRLKFSNAQTERIVSLVRHHMRFIDVQSARIP